MAISKKKKRVLDAYIVEKDIASVVNAEELNDDEAQEYIAERVRVNEAHKDLVVRAVVRRLSEVIEFNPFDLFDVNEMGIMSFKPGMAKKYGHLIQAVSFNGVGKIQVKTVDKLGALIQIARLWGLYKDAAIKATVEPGSMIAASPEFLP